MVKPSRLVTSCHLSALYTSIQLKLKVVMGVCNYVIFLANLLIFNNSVLASQGAKKKGTMTYYLPDDHKRI